MHFHPSIEHMIAAPEDFDQLGEKVFLKKAYLLMINLNGDLELVPYAGRPDLSDLSELDLYCARTADDPFTDKSLMSQFVGNDEIIRRILHDYVYSGDPHASGKLTEQESERWQEIKKKFQKNLAFGSVDSQDRIGQLMVQLSSMGDGLEGIRSALEARRIENESTPKKSRKRDTET